MPSALITGVAGQDGSYLAELLVAKGYTVAGTSRRGKAALESENLRAIAGRLTVLQADMRDETWGRRALAELGAPPDEIYHLAGQTVVARAWEQPLETADSVALGTLRLLETVKREAREARVLVAGSSAMFGDPVETPQRESTPLRPIDPYGAAKAFAHQLTQQYRDVHGLYAVSAMLFNHESPRRGSEFVTRRITLAAARLAHAGGSSGGSGEGGGGGGGQLILGDLEARRDWGFAGDYVVGMWQALQMGEARDYVFGTGEAHSVREFCARAFAAVALDYRAHVTQDERLFRPGDDRVLVADARRAREELRWVPRTSFDELVTLMVEADVARVRYAPESAPAPPNT